MTLHAGPRRVDPAARTLLAAGGLILLATVAVVVVGVVHHLGRSGPVLPVTFARGMSAMAPGQALSGTRWFTAWQFDRIAVAVIVGLAAVYLAGVAAVHRRGRRWKLTHTLSFLAGLGVCVLATCSSVAVYDMTLFSAHMLGHLALVMVAPAFLVCGRPLTLALHATRNPWHDRLRRLIRSRPVSLWFSPPVALAAYVVVIVGTHLTGLMDVIMSNVWAGQLEHVVYLLVGYQFFSLVLADEPLRWRMSMPARQLLLAVAMAVDTFTGVILLQSTQPVGMTGALPRFVDALTETHLGGAIMWVGGDAIMAAVMIVVLLAWWRAPEYRRRASRSWLEQVRTRSLLERTATPGAAAFGDVDYDDAARDAYNSWLARIDQS